MRTVLRCCLVALLSVSLVEAPVLASPSASLGMVMQAERARVGSGEAVSGATLFDGDTLSTDAAGSLRARVGAAQLYLLASSAAAVGQIPGGVSAALKRGTVVFSSAGKEALELYASDARIRPHTAQPTYGQLTLVGPYELLVTSQRGQLEVSVEDEVHIIPEATSYRVLIDPPDAQGPQGAGSKSPKKAARSRILLVALIFIGAGTGIGVWRALISPKDP